MAYLSNCDTKTAWTCYGVFMLLLQTPPFYLVFASVLLIGSCMFGIAQREIRDRSLDLIVAANVVRGLGFITLALFSFWWLMFAI